MAGRPTTHISLEDVQLYIRQGHNKTSIAQLLNISRPTLNGFLKSANIDHLLTKNVMTDEEIDERTSAAKIWERG